MSPSCGCTGWTVSFQRPFLTDRGFLVLVNSLPHLCRLHSLSCGKDAAKVFRRFPSAGCFRPMAVPAKGVRHSSVGRLPLLVLQHHLVALLPRGRRAETDILAVRLRATCACPGESPFCRCGGIFRRYERYTCLSRPPRDRLWKPRRGAETGDQ